MNAENNKLPDGLDGVRWLCATCVAMPIIWLWLEGHIPFLEPAWCIMFLGVVLFAMIFFPLVIFCVGAIMAIFGGGRR